MKTHLLTALIASLLCLPTLAQVTYSPSADNLNNRREFQDDKFGIFIHFGVYSMMADGEWVMENKHINYQEYAKLAGGFCPANFDAAQWVEAIKASGAKYVCFTSRHHDGFSMFGSKHSDYNIVKATPFGRDLLKELSQECEKQGIKLHLYYSLIDWSRDDYLPLGGTGRQAGRPGKGEWATYFKFMNDQLNELLTDYGKIRAVWFDGKWDQAGNPDFNWQFEEMYANIHAINDGCLIGNNHHESPYPGEDIQIFERDLPGENNAGMSGQDISPLPLETCETMNGMWGYKITDQNYKSARQLIHYIVKAAGRNANLLMNIGPQPDGSLPSTSVQRLKEVGEWMSVYGESIYGTRGGRVTPRSWGVTTEKDGKIFVHILDLQDDCLFLPITDIKVKRAAYFNSSKTVTFRQDKRGVVLQLDEVPTDTDCVISLDY